MKRISKTIAMARITARILGVSVFCMTACGDQPTNGFVYELSSEGDYYVVMSYAGKGESVSVPAEYNGKPVKEIAANAFSGNISLTSITVPNSVTAIGQGAFGGCSALRNIVLPFTGSSSNATGESAMFGYVFGQKMYADCVAVKQYYADKEFALYYLPASLTTVGIGKNIAARSFSGMSDLKELSVGAEVNDIGDDAFDGCDSLSVLYLESGTISAAASDAESCGGLFGKVGLIYLSDGVAPGPYISSLGEPSSVNASGKAWKLYGKAQTYRYECENAVLSGWSPMTDVTSGASGNTFISAGGGGSGKVVEFYVYSVSDTKATLSICVGRHSSDVLFSEFLSFSVNGQTVTPEDFTIMSPGADFNWYNWENYEIAEISLAEGVNKVTFQTVGIIGMNFDYIEITAKTVLS